jgi:hypothetical protein
MTGPRCFTPLLYLVSKNLIHELYLKNVTLVRESERPQTSNLGRYIALLEECSTAQGGGLELILADNRPITNFPSVSPARPASRPASTDLHSRVRLGLR